MSTISVTSDLMTQLQGMRQPLELRDQHGILLGYFQPTSSAERYDEMMKTCPYSEEDRRRFATETEQGRPLREILQELESRWPSK
jgi:hypothetical protein